MLIFLNVVNPTNLTDLSDLINEFRENSNEWWSSFMIVNNMPVFHECLF